MYALAYDKLPGRSVYHAPESHTEMQLAQSCNVRRFRQREECFEIGADLLDSSGNPTRRAVFQKSTSAPDTMGPWGI